MMTQEEFMDVLAMRRQGMSYVEIGDDLATTRTRSRSGSGPVAHPQRARSMRPSG